MITEKEFLKEHPGLKGKWAVANHPYAVLSEPQYLYVHNLIHETQLDKQKVIRLTEEQFHNLVVKGECFNTLKIEALWEGTLFDTKLMQYGLSEHRLLEGYKQKVNEVIEKFKHIDGVFWKDQLKKELGLESNGARRAK